MQSNTLYLLLNTSEHIILETYGSDRKFNEIRPLMYDENFSNL